MKNSNTYLLSLILILVSFEYFEIGTFNPKYEYTTQAVLSQEFETLMTAYGEDGWEAISIDSSGLGWNIIFKREKNIFSRSPTRLRNYLKKKN